jgi:hypothetical protein
VIFADPSDATKELLVKSKLPLYVFAIVLLTLLIVPAPTASGSSAFNFQWMGTPASPNGVVPTGWDEQIHVRTPQDTMSAMQAQHGPDCGAPPATHTITQLRDGVYICRNHLMTAISGKPGYGEIALTPNQLADWSSGTTVIQVSVSTLQFNNSDFLEIWIMPFAENSTMPINVTDPDGQGPPKTALRFALNQGAFGGTTGDVYRYDNFNSPGRLPKAHDCYAGSPYCLPALGLKSATLRTTYEIDISSNHIRFGLPSNRVWWTDTDIPALSFTKGVISLTHHSYDPTKHNPGTGIDTWHWSNFYISNADPFTIINGAERSIHADGATTVHFPSPAPANAYLRFSGIGTTQVSFNGGTSWQMAQRQAQKVENAGHFSSYWTPVPAGVTSVMFKGTGDRWYQGPWWVRDPAIWSLSLGSGTPPPTPSPKSSPPPSPSGIPINGVPCTVTLNAKTVTGKCSGTFWPK